MNDLIKAVDGTAFLMEPNALKRAAQVVVAYPRCFTARDVAKERRKRMDRARHAAEFALPSTGIDDPAEREMGAQAVRAVTGKVGVINVHGPMDQHLTTELMKSDGCACDEVAAQLDALLNNPAVGGIVLHCDSPGGYSYGIQELSDKIFEARDRKPIYAIADSMACSANYWVATSAGNVSVTPGGDVGSVGVYCLHVDESKALEAAGLKVTMVSAGKYKGERASFAPLSDEAKANMQELVDADMDRFVGALKRNRDVSADQVRRNFGQGRTVRAQLALEAKMVDGIRTFEALMAKLTGSAGAGSPSRAASVEVLRLRQEHRRRQTALLTLGLS